MPLIDWLTLPSTVMDMSRLRNGRSRGRVSTMPPSAFGASMMKSLKTSSDRFSVDNKLGSGFKYFLFSTLLGDTWGNHPI